MSQRLKQQSQCMPGSALDLLHICLYVFVVGLGFCGGVVIMKIRDLVSLSGLDAKFSASSN